MEQWKCDGIEGEEPNSADDVVVSFFWYNTLSSKFIWWTYASIYFSFVSLDGPKHVTKWHVMKWL